MGEAAITRRPNRPLLKSTCSARQPSADRESDGVGPLRSPVARPDAGRRAEGGLPDADTPRQYPASALRYVHPPGLSGTRYRRRGVEHCSSTAPGSRWAKQPPSRRARPPPPRLVRQGAAELVGATLRPSTRLASNQRDPLGSVASASPVTSTPAPPCSTATTGRSAPASSGTMAAPPLNALNGSRAACSARHCRQHQVLSRSDSF